MSHLAFTKPWKVRGQEFELKLIDTAGQDEYAIFPAQHSMDIAGYVLVYSVYKMFPLCVKVNIF